MLVGKSSRNETRMVLFADGTTRRMIVYVYTGAAMIGEPTAYVYRDGKLTWLVPGESVDFVEAK